jgi:signal peptidase I
MEPIFHQWDFIIVDKITPKFGHLKRGDVIVFVPEGKSVPYIKRIIGLPNETVTIKDSVVTVCGPDGECFDVDESYLGEGTITSIDTCNISEFAVDGEWFFVLGDNRDHSTDSRCCFWLACYDWANYLVYERDMIGKVAAKLYPSLEKHW